MKEQDLPELRLAGPAKKDQDKKKTKPLFIRLFGKAAPVLVMQAINKFTEPMMKVVGKGSEWLFCQNEGKDEKRKKGCLCNAEAPAVGPSGGKEGWLGCQKQIWDVKKDGDTYTLVKLREAPVYYKDYITDSDDGKKTLDSFTSEGCSVVETDPDAPKKTVGNLCNVIKNVNATSKRRRNLRKHGTGLKPDTEAMVKILRPQFPEDKLTIHNIDFLEAGLEGIIPAGKKVLFVGNLPYAVGSAILQRILEYPDFRAAILMFQKEVCQRIVAQPDTKHYGLLALSAQSRSHGRFFAGCGQIWHDLY